MFDTDLTYRQMDSYTIKFVSAPILCMSFCNILFSLLFRFFSSSTKN